MSFLVREMGLEPTRLWLDTGTSSLPVCLFQHSRIGYALSNAKFIIARKEYLSRKRSSNIFNTQRLKRPLRKYATALYYFLCLQIEITLAAVVPLLQQRSNQCHHLHIKVEHVHGKCSYEETCADAGNHQRNLSKFRHLVSLLS